MNLKKMVTPCRRRVVGVVGVALTVVGAVGVSGTGRSAADTVAAQAFSLNARADALSVEVIEPTAPVVPRGQAVFVTPASAQAAYDSLGASEAFASAPFAGDFITDLPGTMNGVQGSVSVPSYPLYVRSSHPVRPKAESQGPPHHISARSDSSRSVAQAEIGFRADDTLVSGAQATAATGWDRSQKRLVAESTSAIKALTVGGVLRLAEVTAWARLSTSPGEERHTETSFSIGRMTIAGHEASITDNGLSVGPVTVPGTGPSDAAALIEILDQAGITLTYLAARETPTGIDAAGLAVTTAVQAPGREPLRTTVILGRVSAHAAVPSQPPALDVPGDAISGSEQENPIEAPPAVFSNPDPAVIVGPGGEAAEKARVSSVPAFASAQDPPARLEVDSAFAGGAPRRVRVIPGRSVGGLYLLLVAGGLVVAMGSGLCGRLGVLRVRPAGSILDDPMLRLPSR